MEKDLKSSKNQEQLVKYIRDRVMPILEPLQLAILNQRPADLRRFSYTWLQNRGDECAFRLTDYESEDDDEPQEIFKEKRKKKLQGRRGCRKGVSGDTTSSLISSQLLLSTSSRKQLTQEHKIRIFVNLKNSVLLKSINHSSLTQIIDRMKSIAYQAGDVVIREGEVGNEYFLVDEGYFECTIAGKKGVEKVYSPGQTFGQLALLYNSPRASTIVAKSDGRLFVLGRQQFNFILRDSAIQKIKIYEEMFNKVQIFETLNRYERSKLYESMQEIEFADGKYVIREGDIGDCFYIVIWGKLVAEKQHGEEIRPVYYYKQGDYFGEISLIRNISRQASVKSLTKVKLVYIDRASFKRILGPLETILKRNEFRYSKMKEELDKQKEMYSV